MRHLLVTFLMLGIACGDDGLRPDSGAPDSSTADVGRDVDIPDGASAELAEYIRDNNVTVLALGEDGVEYGQNLTAADGMARFFSPEHEALVEFEMDSEEDGHASDLPVILMVSADREMVYTAMGPDSPYAPTLHTLTLPSDGEHAMTIDDAEVADRFEIDYDPETDPDPFADEASKSDDRFGGTAQPLLVGVVVVFAIRTILVTALVETLAGVFGNLVDGACNLATPLYAERCAMLGKIATFGFKILGGLRVGGITGWGDLGVTFVDEALLENCDDIGAALVSVVTDVSPSDLSPPREMAYRQLAQKWNYLIHRMETDPQPGQRDWDWAARQSARLGQLRSAVQERYLVPMNVEEEDSGLLMTYVKTAVDEFFSDFDGTAITAARTSVGGAPWRTYFNFSRDLDLDGVVDEVDSVAIAYSYTTQPTRLWRAPDHIYRYYKALNCGATFVRDLAVTVSADGSTHETGPIPVQGVIDGALNAMNAAITAEYQRFWGDLPMGTCLADIMEPNQTWQLAHASPVPGTLGPGGGDVTTLERLNLCDGLGMSGNDIDWYAYNNPAIDFRVQARFFQSDGSAGSDQRVCIDVHYYSEIYELAGTPPDILRSACGAGDFATTEFGVRRSIGERWSQIILRVRPEDPSTILPVDYNLRFN